MKRLFRFVPNLWLRFTIWLELKRCARMVKRSKRRYPRAYNYRGWYD